MIALVLAIAALLTQPQPLPADFVAGAMTRSQVVQTDGFVGLMWACENEPIDANMEGEECYAGLVETGTGPDNATPSWSLETGP